MHNRQVSIRLLDPPLLEFLPDPNSKTFESDVVELSSKTGISIEKCLTQILSLKEVNPLLGFRGCRLSIIYPEMTEMQTRAIIGAALAAHREGVLVKPRIMIPMVCSEHEVEAIVPIIKRGYANECANAIHCVPYSIGCMLEVPRACIRADQIVSESGIDFVSIGSNDLTQLIFGMSKDDTQRFLPEYIDKHIFAKDPFVSIDVRGVGTVINLTVARCRKANPEVQIGICGEHAGDPQSIYFFNKLGLDYISCTPYRIPMAKLAAAQAHIEETAKTNQCINRSPWFGFPLHTATVFPFIPYF